MFFVYLLQSLKDNKFYIGQTQEVKKRLSRHNSGQVASTKARRPFKLIGYEVYKTRDEARLAEHIMKLHSDRKKKFIQKLLS